MGGGRGQDTLLANVRADTLWGQAGHDTLAGNLGADVMTGGAGRDEFRFFLAADSRTGAADLITDFTPGTDRIDLRALDLDYDGNRFSGEDSLIWRHVGRETHVLADLDGDGRAEMTIRLSGQLSLDGDDFLL
ncbi:M10 family metallopeptidase C-terminal domain-containing protein [Paracoccus zeaxanthinifaciens]|uniref:M10 family metallopeptidase C-terminal domain-containing protein n=1 Tax=Paracoccus zeaxanthinifaciens TaxID=187400 RepID=UPI001FE04264|nr:M10 family metallopeptidase C-terminal domain-containing protein [Paracoccus zeaxanthinifaciens]